jgi:hypothetical protein
MYFLFIIIFNFRLHHLIFLGLAIHITILKVLLTGLSPPLDFLLRKVELTPQ